MNRKFVTLRNWAISMLLSGHRDTTANAGNLLRCGQDIAQLAFRIGLRAGLIDPSRVTVHHTGGAFLSKDFTRNTVHWEIESEEGVKFSIVLDTESKKLISETTDFLIAVCQ